jgi:hypothetical protein
MILHESVPDNFCGQVHRVHLVELTKHSQEDSFLLIYSEGISGRFAVVESPVTKESFSVIVCVVGSLMMCC